MPTEPVTIQPTWRRYACCFVLDMPMDTVNLKLTEIADRTALETSALGVGPKSIAINSHNNVYACEFWLIY